MKNRQHWNIQATTSMFCKLYSGNDNSSKIHKYETKFPTFPKVNYGTQLVYSRWFRNPWVLQVVRKPSWWLVTFQKTMRPLRWHFWAAILSTRWRTSHPSYWRAATVSLRCTAGGGNLPAGPKRMLQIPKFKVWFLRNGMPPKGKNNQLHRSWDIFAFFLIVYNAVRHPTWLSPKMCCFYPWSMVMVCSRCSSKVKPASRGPKQSNTWWKQCPVKSQNDFQICPHKPICPDTHFPLGGCICK